MLDPFSVRQHRTAPPPKSVPFCVSICSGSALPRVGAEAGLSDAMLRELMRIELARSPEAVARRRVDGKPDADRQAAPAQHR